MRRAGLFLIVVVILVGISSGTLSAGTVPRIGDPLLSIVIGLSPSDDSPTVALCPDGNIIFIVNELDDTATLAASVYLINREGSDKSIPFAIADFRVPAVALYGDRQGDGFITDIGVAGDEVFGEGPCDYLSKVGN